MAAIRPILEYCSSLWLPNLPTYLSDQIESIQKRAIRIIYHATKGMPYLFALSYAGLESLKYRRESQAKDLFNKILDPTSCIHCLLPPPRDDAILAKLRNPHRYPITSGRTKKYQSFINFALKNYQ